MSAVKRFQSLLEQGLSKHWQKLYDRSSKQLVADYKQWKGKSLVYDQDTDISEATGYIYFAQHQIRVYLDAIDSRLHEYNEFHRQYTYAADKEEQHTYILQFCRTIGASTLQLRKDKQALDRWFDIDALTERYIRIQNDDESMMTYAVSRLATLIEHLWQTNDKESKLAIFNRFEFDSLLLPLLTYKHGDRVKLAAFKAISDIVKGLPQDQAISLPNQLVRYIYRFAIDRAQPVWNQVEALKLIGKLNPKQLLTIYQERLNGDDVQDSDSLFVRHYLVLALADFYHEEDKLLAYIPKLLADNKPYVRKAFCDALPKLPEQQRSGILARLLTDESDAVKANAILSMNHLVSDDKSAHQYLEVLVTELSKEHSEFVLRTSLHAIIQLLNTAKSYLGQEQYQSWFIAFENALTKLNTESELTTVRRWASETREQLWAANSVQFEQLKTLFAIAPHKRKRLSKEQRQLLETEQGLRWLASQTNEQFGFDISNKHIVREHKEGFRLWRFLFEWRTPATDKRQNYNHTKGRVFYGLNSVPAQKLAEVSATKVPGEPLHIAEDGNWRPYLPLVDQIISSLDQSWPTKPLKIFTNEGVTLVTPPSGFVARLIARTKLTLNFAHYAKLRNWSSEDSNEPSAYLASLAKLGFTLSIEGHQSSQGDRYPIDAKVARFFPMAIAPPFVMTWWNQYQSYFFSVYQNTLSQLGIFLAAMLTGFLGLHLKANMSMKRARRSIPLVIGGWGSRGKSGTERLKAALFNSLGFSVLSKTTGCEAMFLYSQKNRPLFEMFLFRPFDKATIWEQVNVTRIAKDLKSDVMLWECMGLTPRYIEILQQQWMQDDIATITNCYPDHEDLQGPSGVDIPKVMMKFVPKKSLLLTSEENMLPYLKLAADQNQTKLVNVNWLQAGLITEDVQERFPYQEHPNNIALVVSLAKQLGIDEAFALKEMADKVVPDLGVLKTFPIAEVDGKRIQFINGMSANERFGAIGNWQRTQLDKCTLAQTPETWVTTVINNRDDRVARSRVFAEMMVRDLSVDRHFLIGNNLTGLVGFIEQSWQAFMLEQLPEGEQLSNDHALKVIEQLATQLKIPTTQALVNNRLTAMCQGESISLVETNTLDHKAYSSPNNDVKAIEEVIRYHQLDINNLESYIALVNGLENNNYAQWRQQASKVLWQWFESKLVLVHDYYASGNAINHKLAQSTPPGLLNKVMGMQNIKGTGLDLVYRWQAWDRTYLLCNKLQDTDEDIARDALQTLTKIKDFGILDKQLISDSLKQAVSNHYFQTELCQAQITAIESQLQSQLALITLDEQEQENSFIDKTIDFIEAFLDTGDAIKRRKKANLIIKDLVNEHISQAMAAQQLQLLTQKQKGGWLKKALRTRYRKLKH